MNNSPQKKGLQKIKLPKLQEWQKITLVSILAIFLVSSIFLGYRFATDQSFRESVRGITTGQTSVTDARSSFVREQVSRLQSILGDFNYTDDYYKEYTFLDLDIYPKGFQDRFFSSNEQRNEQIGGANGDPDGDGLVNKLEFFYGSNPKKRQSLCEGVGIGLKPIESSPFVCDARTDKDLVDDFISPMTGLSLDTADSFRVLNQDVSVVNNMKESFEQASAEGVDLPILYQQSLLINLEDELKTRFPISPIEDSAQAILEYRSFRLEIFEVLVGGDEISPLTQIYTATEVEQFESLELQYQKMIKAIARVKAPESYAKTHQLYQLLFDRLLALATHRKEGVQNKTFETEAFREKSRKFATEITWAYRRLKEEGAQNDSKFT